MFSVCRNVTVGSAATNTKWVQMFWLPLRWPVPRRWIRALPPNQAHDSPCLGGSASEAGRVAEAIPLHEQTLTASERVLGPDHPDTLTSRHNLAYAYQKAGQPSEDPI